MQVEQLIEELKTEKEKGSFWKKWWVKKIIALIEKIVERKANNFLDKKIK
jgi:hypothetical protein